MVRAGDGRSPSPSGEEKLVDVTEEDEVPPTKVVELNKRRARFHRHAYAISLLKITGRFDFPSTSRLYLTIVNYSNMFCLYLAGDSTARRV